MDTETTAPVTRPSQRGDDLGQVRGEWLTTREFAALVGITHNSAAAALARCARWQQWNGIHLIVRRVRNPKGGGFQFEVLRSSLPMERLPVPLVSSDLSAEWIDVQEFARLFGISREAASKVFRRAQGGTRWRGALLTVRRVLSGGKGGSAWRVARCSLPAPPADPVDLMGAFAAEEWLSVRDVARLFGVPLSWLYYPAQRWAAGHQSRGVLVKVVREGPSAKGREQRLIWKADLAVVASVVQPRHYKPRRPVATLSYAELLAWPLGETPKGP
jgi:hypothetical protein